MEDVELTSPFKNPSVNPAPRRTRLGSGSSVSSTEREACSPHHHRHNSSTNSHAGSEGRDENDPSVSSGNGSEHSRVNPFEKDVLAGLQRSFWSPSILEIKETPPQKSWAIEHLSHLFPKDIENSPSTHQNSFPVDPQTEAKAQADIDTYFSRGSIVPTPSPMKEKVIKVIGGEVVTRIKTLHGHVYCHGQSPIARGLGGGLAGSNNMIKKLKKQVPVIERWTQTTLSLPVNLPTYIEQMLWQYSQPDVNLCGTSGEAVLYNSQKSDSSDNPETGDINDSGKNSSSLNNSIRRRLELSFGEDPDGEESQGVSSQAGPASPIPDPFRRNHIVSTPPNSSSSFFHMNTTTSDLEMQLMRCEFTPETRGPSSLAATPGITPIHDEADEVKFMHHACSTPRRTNSTGSKRWMTKEEPLFPSSPMVTSRISTPSPSTSIPSSSKDDPLFPISPMVMSRITTPSPSTPSPSSSAGSKPCNNVQTSSGGTDNNAQFNLLRRARAASPVRVHSKKRTSASSFDDSQFLGDYSSPPAKLFRRNSEKHDATSVSDS